MIRNTRLATEEEKSLVIHYIIKNSYTNEQDFHVVRQKEWEADYVLWEKASFIVIEVQDFDSKIIVVNHVTSSYQDFLDVVTAHYLLHYDNSITDISSVETALYL